MVTSTEPSTRHLAWTAGEGGNWDSVLRADGEEVGSLHFETGARATGKLEDRTWILEWEGPALHPRIVVRTPESIEPVATFTSRWSGGADILFANGVRYCWNPSHVWSATYCFRRESKTASVCVRQGPAGRRGSRVEICPEAAGRPETPILLLLAGFLDVRMSQGLSNLAGV